jgi:glycosyltransferase involved in cell wall biosynthesis
VPYVLSIDSIQKHHTPLSFLSRRCSSIIVPCQSVRKSVGRRVSDKVQLIEYGTFAEKEPCCFRNTDAMNSMIVNCDFRGKNESVSNLLSAIRHLFIDGNEFVTIFLSSGGDERDIRKQINAFGLRQVVTMAPRDYRWRSAVAAGDVFVRAQKSKTFSPVLLEAMAMGCTIAGCRGGVDDLLLDGKTACVYDAEDELMIYNCLGRILNNRDYARQLGANSQNYIRKNSSVSKMLEQILSAYRFECPAAMVSV